MAKLFYITGLSLVLFLTSAMPQGFEGLYNEIRQWYRDQQDGTVSFYLSDQQSPPKGSTLYQIMLIRHGKPRIKRVGWCSYRRAAEYVFRYDTVGVMDIPVSPIHIRPMENIKIFSSPLKRAKDTAEKIFNSHQEVDTDLGIITDPVFIEFRREVIPLPVILPIDGWLSISRLFWILGLHSENIPGFKEERARAAVVAERLDQEALENGKVVLVAHGFLNKFVIRNLVKKGWRSSKKGGSDYLSVSVMTKIMPAEAK